MTQTSSPDGVCLPCGLQKFERNRYFDGKLLVTRDFQQEQDHFRGKNRLHNDLLHGTGTVCGLKVEQHPNPACRHRFVVLEPGLALDCCGNEIVVHEERIVDLQELIEEALRAGGLFPTTGDPADHDIYLRIAYTECNTEPVPALLDDCGCTEANVEFNRTREGYRLFVDLTEPVSESTDPLDARLEWQHTLFTAHPRAIVVDRSLQRLYVAEWDGDDGWLRMYDTSNHSLLVPPVSLSAEPAIPVAASRSNLGDLVYVAAAIEEDVEGSPITSVHILIFDQNLLETAPDTAMRASLTVDAETLAGLDVSPLDDSLYALLPDGRIMRWSSNSIRDWVDGVGSEPAPVVQDLRNADSDPTTATVTPGDMTIRQDGRWMVVADTSQPRLIVLNLAQFATEVPLGDDVSNLMKGFALPAGHVPFVVEFSYDGEYLYALGRESQMLYRIEVRTSLDDFIPIIPSEGNAFSAVLLANPPEAGDPLKPLPLDMGISPRDNWIYVLRREFDAAGDPRDRGEVLILSVDAINERRGPDTSDLENTPEIGRGVVHTKDNALFQNLAFLGQRLYVAGETLPADPTDEPTQGSISILYVNEAACDAFIDRVIEGCDTCDDHTTGVIIASIQGYQWNEPMTSDQLASVNVIDNLTHRPMVPSTNTLRQVIECMLEKGISEGIPGPRGAAGPQGDDGARGPGITDVDVNTLSPGSSATADLEPIPGDPEGDQRLLLGIPAGADGDAGPRGPGITEVVANTLPPGSSATADLEPIPDDPEGDQRLLLGIPRGADGASPTPEEFNRVTHASWHHDEVISITEFAERLFPVGFVVLFREPVREDAVHRRHAFAKIRRREQMPGGIQLECECVIPMDVEPVESFEIEDREVTWLIGDTPTPNRFELVTAAEPVRGQSFVRGLRLVPPEEWSNQDLLSRFIGHLMGQVPSAYFTVTIVLRSEWILDERGRALDGDHIWPGVPEGPTAAGVNGRMSGNGTQGGDWVSVLHIMLPPH